MSLIAILFQTDGFPPRWQCGEGWTPLLGWLHIISDVAIWAAYMAIPATMWVFARKRTDLGLPRVFWLYIAFILLCGFTHLIEAGIFYWPVYRLSGVVKFATAAVSLLTVLALIQVMPRALTIPGLTKVNEDLRREVELRKQSERRYLKLLEASSSVIWTTSAAGKLVPPQPSWEAYTGQTVQEYAGDGWMAAIFQDDLPAVRADWEQAVRTAENFRTEGRIWSARHQAYRMFESMGTPILDEQGAVQEWIGTLTDIEDHMRLSDQLLAANHTLEMKNQQTQRFLYTVSHDLKSPVVTIQGFAGFMRQDLNLGKTDRLAHFIERIEEAGDIMGRSLDDLLQLSRLGVVPSKPEALDLGKVVQEVVEQVEPEIRSNGSSVEVMPGLPTLRMDPQHARYLFQNLIGNALKYGVDEQGVANVQVGWEAAGDAIVLYVQDQGPGIPAEHQDRVFEVFERLQNTTKGTGIGLSIVRQIADNYGGEASVISPAPGIDRGCRFAVRLPITVCLPTEH